MADLRLDTTTLQAVVRACGVIAACFESEQHRTRSASWLGSDFVADAYAASLRSQAAMLQSLEDGVASLAALAEQTDAVMAARDDDLAGMLTAVQAAR